MTLASLHATRAPVDGVAGGLQGQRPVGEFCVGHGSGHPDLEGGMGNARGVPAGVKPGGNRRQSPQPRFSVSWRVRFSSRR